MNPLTNSSPVPPTELDSTAPFASEYYRSILHQLPQSFCVGNVLFDEHGAAVDYRLVELNAMFEQQTTLRNPVGRTLRELAPASDISWYERLGQVVRTGQAAHFEQQVPFGVDYWYEVQALPTGPPGSHQVALLLTDISARRQTEMALRSSQDRQAFLVQLGDELRPLLDAAQVQEVAARLLGQHLHANQVHYGETQGDDVVISQGYGDGLPAMTGRFRSVDFGERLTATHRAGIVQVIRDIETDAANTEAERQVLRQARIGAYITVPLLKQGHWVATLAVHSLTPRPWTVDEVRLVEAVAERTWAAVERARAETALRESEEKYRAIFQSINEGFMLLDIQFDEQGQAQDIVVRDANPAQDRIDGVRALIGKRVREMLPDYELKWMQRYAHVAQSGEPAHFEDWAEGTQRWYEVDASRVGETGSTLVAIVYNDITARKQQQQLLRASEAQLAADLAGMRRLYELQSKLANQTDVQAAFQDVLALACEFTGTDRGCVQMLSPDGQRLEMFVWQGYASDGPFISFFRYEGLEAGCEVARVQRKRLIIEDTVGFEGLEGTEAGAAAAADGIRAAQSTPMTSRANETIGVISTQFRQPHRPSDHELRLLDMLAWTAAEFLERHRADAALRESEQRFRLMADAVPQIVWLTDAEGRVEFFNQQWSDYTGVPYEPTTAAEVSASFVHPDDGAATMAAFTQARATGTTFLVEHRIRSQAGDYRWFLVRAEPYREASTGKIIRWFGASVDIHDRKQAEIALEKAHQRLQLAMNTGRIFSFEMNLATRALELSDNVDLVMGFPLPDHIDSTFELIHPDDLQPTVALINGAIDSRGSYASDYRLVNPATGEVVWFHSQAAFTQSNASGEWRFVGIAQNITESKRAAAERACTEAALQASEQRLRVAINAADMGTWNWNLATDEVQWNDQHFALFGREPQPGPLTSEDFARQVHPADREWVWQRLAAAVTQQHVFEAEFRIVRADDGETRWMSGYGQAIEIGPAGDTQRMSGVVFDITPRKQAEEQLREFMASLEQQVAERTQALRESSHLLQLVFDTSSMAISVQEAVRDANGDIQDFCVLLLNKELARELGRTDMVGKHYVQEYPGMRASGLFDLMRATVETGEPQHLEYYYPYEGFNRWFSCTFVKLNDGVVATNLDITERKQAEADLLNNLTLLQQAEEVASLGSWDYELATGEFRWSAGMYQLFGLPLGSPIRPATYLDFVVAEDRPVAERIVQGITTGGTGFEETLRIQVGETVKTVRVKATGTFDATGEPRRMLGVDLDISEVQRLAAENLHLRLTQQQVRIEAVLEAQEEERRRIAESLHNGLGQLLFATKLQFNQLEVAGQLATTPALVTAQREANRLLSEAIRQTRSLSHELTPGVVAEFGLPAALQDTCRNLNTPTLHWQCAVFLDEDHPLPLSLQVAVYRLAQELTQNVAKHAQASQAILDVETLPGWVVLHLEDDGRGFEPDAPTTGIGLKTLHNRVALLGGTVHLKSAIGQGTRLQVRIPFVSPPA